ncbi:MAG: M42 family metallopeptidase [Candidatus Riflebacteria bacterium]|nr:M42 family metallopeptidase [Candidatus Riflebacteria bacterium]
MPRGKSADARSLLKHLTLLNGAAGFEQPVAAAVRRLLAGKGQVSHDRLGSVLVENKGTAADPRVMLAAHMDEVGFLVRGILDNGLIRFTTLGGWWAHTLPAQRVTVIGRKGEVPGIIAAVPPHHLGPAEREKLMAVKNMAIDIGAASAKEVQELGIDVGDPILPAGDWVEMANPDIVCSKAFDDRAGLAMMIEVMRRLGRHPNTVVATATVQEEVGIRGARTAVTLARPDVAVILEAPPADDFPGCAELVQGALRKGPQIRACDPTMIPKSGLVQFFKERAAALRIPFQVAVRETGGTDAAAIHQHAQGVPSVVVGVPVRYAHSHRGLLSLTDFEQTVALVTDVVSRLDRRTLDRLVL